MQSMSKAKPWSNQSNTHQTIMFHRVTYSLYRRYIQFIILFSIFSWSSSADAYNIFIDSGSNPDTYLSPDFNQIFNNNSSLYFNGSFDGTSNSTPIFTQSNINDTNNSETYTNIPGEEVTELVIMAVTSIILGLVILITVIGNYYVY